MNFLRGMNIETLSITGIPCTDLSPVRTLINLKTLCCSQRQADMLAGKLDRDSVTIIIEPEAVN